MLTPSRTTESVRCRVHTQQRKDYTQKNVFPGKEHWGRTIGYRFFNKRDDDTYNVEDDRQREKRTTVFSSLSVFSTPRMMASPHTLTI